MRAVKYLLAIITMAVLFLDMPAQAQSVVEQLREARQKERASDLDGAIQLYEQITTNTEANQRQVAQAYYRMGVCYLRNGDRDNAKQQFEHLMSEFPRKLTAVANARRELKKIRRQERSEEMKRARADQPGRGLTKTNLVSPKGPPAVASTTPANFTDNVPADMRQISVTFDQQMMNRSWSWTRLDRRTFPKMVGRPRYDVERKICTLGVKLKPGTVYFVGINYNPLESPPGAPGETRPLRGFKSASGEAAKAYALVFATADIMGRPTPIPEEMAAKAKAINAGEEPAELIKPAGDELLAMVPAESLFCVRVNNFDYTLSQIDQFLAGVSPIPMGTSMLVRMQFAKMLGSPELKGVKMGGGFAIFGPILGTDMSDPDNIAILVPVTDYKEFVSGNPNVSQPDRNGVSKITSTGIHPLLVTQVKSYALITPQGNDSELIATAKSISEGKMPNLASALDAAEAKQAAEQPIWAYGNIQQVSKSFGPLFFGTLQQAKTTMAGPSTGMGPMGSPENIIDIYIKLLETLMKETKSLTIAVNPKPNALNITYTMSAVPGTKMADTYFADPAAMRKLSDKLKEPKQIGAEIKPILALLPEADKADFVGTYNLVNQFKMALAFAPVPMPQIDIPTKSDIVFAGKVSKGTMTIDIALPKEHLAEIVAAATMMIQQQMMQPMPMPGQPTMQPDINRTRITTTKANLKSLNMAVNRFKMDTGRFPNDEEGLMALIKKPSDVTNYAPGGYLDTTEMPRDAWGRDFIYKRFPESGKPFVIMSYGADGEKGGQGYDADLLSTD